jgi:hypothetical protein
MEGCWTRSPSASPVAALEDRGGLRPHRRVAFDRGSGRRDAGYGCPLGAKRREDGREAITDRCRGWTSSRGARGALYARSRGARRRPMTRSVACGILHDHGALPGEPERPLVTEPTGVEAEREAADLAAIAPPLLARVAGGALALAGFFTSLLGVQTASIARFHGVWAVAIVVMFALGAATFLAGVKVARLRGWAAVLGTTSAGLTALLGAGWALFSLLSGLLSLLAFGVVPLAAVAGGLAATVIGAGLRADAARARLRDAGLEAGD